MTGLATTFNTLEQATVQLGAELHIIWGVVLLLLSHLFHTMHPNDDDDGGYISKIKYSFYADMVSRSDFFIPKTSSFAALQQT